MLPVLDVVLSAFPSVGARIARFRAAGMAWHDATVVVGSDNDRIVSTAVIFRRAVRTARGEARFGGIGAVATRPESRGRGLASAVIAYCEDVLRAERYQTAVLFCSIAPFYERLGWMLAPDETLPPPVLTGGDAEVRIEQLDLHGDRFRQAQLYERAGTGALCRPLGVWREYSGWVREDAGLALGAFREGELVAYVRGRKRSDGLELLESTSLPGEQGALRPLLERQFSLSGACVWASSPDAVMMYKPLSARSGNGTDGPWLSPADFRGDLPWHPRVWWPIDRF